MVSRESNLVLLYLSTVLGRGRICRYFVFSVFTVFSLCYQWTRSLVNPAGAYVGFLAHSHCSKNKYPVVFEDFIQTFENDGLIMKKARVTLQSIVFVYIFSLYMHKK